MRKYETYALFFRHYFYAYIFNIGLPFYTPFFQKQLAIFANKRPYGKHPAKLTNPNFMKQTRRQNRHFETSPKLRFNLKQTANPDKPTQIMLAATVNRQRIRVYTKLRVEPKFWDPRGYRCRTDIPLSRREQARLNSINGLIESIAGAVAETDGRLAQKGQSLTHNDMRQAVDNIKQHADRQRQNPIVALRQLAQNYENQANRNGQRGIGATKTTYLTAIRRLEEFDRQREHRIKSFEEFNRRMFDEFNDFLLTRTYGKHKKHYTRNTVVNTLKVVKNMLHRAYDSDLSKNNDFRKVQTTLPANTSEQVYLRENEIRRIAAVETLSRRECEVRDMFVIACYTALRISDIQQLQDAVIRNGVISLYQKKTKDLVEIPILKEIAPLIEHYRNAGFPSIDRTKANRIIRTLAERCRINEVITQKEQRGGETIITRKPKYELITFHTARRSCITNLYKRGYPANYVMSLSGHKSIQAFQRYMKASSRELMASFVHLLKKDKAIIG